MHIVELLLAERMYKLNDEPEIFEFMGPPHPEDPQGNLFCMTCAINTHNQLLVFILNRSNSLDTPLF